MHLETKDPDCPSLVVIMPNLQEVMNSERSSTFSLMETSSILAALYGSAGLLPVFAFEKDILGITEAEKGFDWGLLAANEVVSERIGLGLDRRIDRIGRERDDICLFIVECLPFICSKAAGLMI